MVEEIKRPPFGQLLWRCRRNCTDPDRGGHLTQERLAELLDVVAGVPGYSDVRISNWERGEETIRHDKRDVLVGLVQVLVKCGGIATLLEANRLLATGGYRRLNDEEIGRISESWVGVDVPAFEKPGNPLEPTKTSAFWRNDVTVADRGIDRLIDEKVTPHEPLLQLPAKIYPQLIGRERELARLFTGFEARQKMPALYIVGLGGIGKTALAREAVEQALKKGLFEFVVWTSAKTERFVDTGIEKIEVSDYSFDQLLSDIGRQCGQLDIPQMPFTQKLSAVKYLLSQTPVLIVLDNLETVENAAQLLDDVLEIRGQSQLLITSRHFIPHPLVTPVRLGGFPLDEGLLFLRAESKLKGIDAVFHAGERTLEQIHNVTGGAPLAMKLVVGQIFYTSMDDVLQILVDARFEEPDREFYRFVFKHSWDLLSLAARKVLVTMSVFSVKIGGTRTAIQIVSKVDEGQFMPALKNLIFMSLVDPSQGLREKRYTIHQLTHYFVLSDIVKKWG
ncbi:MAG: ATP-binding protein [Ardenticatenales bacterium]|nr:ATP-binding protein [Ardenticatenales bacterium]